MGDEHTGFPPQVQEIAPVSDDLDVLDESLPSTLQADCASAESRYTELQ
jgi:hypothetical protein